MAIFTRVVEAGTLNGAAGELGLPKSTVGRKIASLEARLGTHPGARRGNTAHLTPQPHDR